MISYMHAYITHEIILYEIKISYYISYMKSHHDFKVYEIISLKSYELYHDIISLHEFAK